MLIGRQRLRSGDSIFMLQLIRNRVGELWLSIEHKEGQPPNLPPMVAMTPPAPKRRGSALARMFRSSDVPAVGHSAHAADYPAPLGPEQPAHHVGSG